MDGAVVALPQQDHHLWLQLQLHLRQQRLAYQQPQSSGGSAGGSACVMQRAEVCLRGGCDLGLGPGAGLDLLLWRRRRRHAHHVLQRVGGHKSIAWGNATMADVCAPMSTRLLDVRCLNAVRQGSPRSSVAGVARAAAGAAAAPFGAAGGTAARCPGPSHQQGRLRVHERQRRCTRRTAACACASGPLCRRFIDGLAPALDK